MTIRRWLDNEVSLDPLKNLKIAVIGYGIQGAAQASNMKDSGLDVCVGLRPNGNTWAKAQNDNHKVKGVSDAVKESDIIHILIPDMELPYLVAGMQLQYPNSYLQRGKKYSLPKESDCLI